MSVTREPRRRVRAEQSVPRFEPCLPRPASEPPTGPGWIHEVKHDSFRILAHQRGRSVRLVTRNGHDLADWAMHWISRRLRAQSSTRTTAPAASRS